MSHNQNELTAVHASRLMISRTVRAFSRAYRSELTMDTGVRSSHTKYSWTASPSSFASAPNRAAKRSPSPATNTVGCQRFSVGTSASNR